MLTYFLSDFLMDMNGGYVYQVRLMIVLEEYIPQREFKAVLGFSAPEPASSRILKYSCLAGDSLRSMSLTYAEAFWTDRNEYLDVGFKGIVYGLLLIGVGLSVSAYAANHRSPHSLFRERSYGTKTVTPHGPRSRTVQEHLLHSRSCVPQVGWLVILR